MSELQSLEKELLRIHDDYINGPTNIIKEKLGQEFFKLESMVRGILRLAANGEEEKLQKPAIQRDPYKSPWAPPSWKKKEESTNSNSNFKKECPSPSNSGKLTNNQRSKSVSSKGNATKPELSRSPSNSRRKDSKSNNGSEGSSRKPQLTQRKSVHILNMTSVFEKSEVEEVRNSSKSFGNLSDKNRRLSKASLDSWEVKRNNPDESKSARKNEKWIPMEKTSRLKALKDKFEPDNSRGIPEKEYPKYKDPDLEAIDYKIKLEALTGLYTNG